MSYVIVQNQTGALPMKIPFALPITGNVTLAVSGTCWSNLAGATCGVSVLLDGNKLGDMPLLFNAASQHQALPTHFFPINLGEGQHTITLVRLTDTTVSDKNDYFSLWIID